MSLIYLYRKDGDTYIRDYVGTLSGSVELRGQWQRDGIPFYMSFTDLGAAIKDTKAADAMALLDTVDVDLSRAIAVLEEVSEKLPSLPVRMVSEIIAAAQAQVNHLMDNVRSLL